MDPLMASQIRSNQAFADPAPTVSLDDVNDGEYTPVQRDQLDLSCMVDRAYSMAEWSMNGQSVASGPNASSDRGTPGNGVDGHATTVADLAALDSMYTALSSFGMNQDSGVMQSDSLSGSNHTSPSPVPYASPASITDATQDAAPHHPYQDQLYATVSDDVGRRQHVSNALPTMRTRAGEAHHSKSMAAARSALMEMQSQGLTYQNIQELVQNIQDLLNCLRERQDVGNVINQVQIDERVRQAVLDMIASRGPHAAYDASMLFAAAAAGNAVPPAHHSQGHPGDSPSMRSPHAAAPPPLTPDRSSGSGAPVSGKRCHTPPRRGSSRRAHDSGRVHPYASPSSASMHGTTFAPDLSPPPTPGVFNTPPNLTPRNHERSGHSGTLSHSRVHGASTGQIRRAGAQVKNSAASDADAASDNLPQKPAFKISALQSMYDDKAASEPLPGHKGGTGVFIPGLHRQSNTTAGAGVSGPLPGMSAQGFNGGGSSKAHVSAALSDVACSLSLGTADIHDAQTSPDSLAGSAELPRGRSTRYSEMRSTPRALDRCANPRAPPPMGYPNLGPLGSLNVDSAYSGSLVDPGAYSGSFYTQELPEDEESRDLSGSGPFRHMSYQTYGGGEMSCTLYSTEAGVGGRSGLLPRAGDDISPSPHQRGPPRNSSGRLAGFSAPIPESTLYGEPDEHHSLSASLSPHSGSIDVVPGHTPTPPPAAALRRPGQTDCLADALGHLSIPSDPSATPAPGASSVAAAAAYRRAMRASAAAMAPPHAQPPGGNHMGHASWQAAPYAAAPPAPRADVRGLPSAGECIPLTVSQWSQDHTSVTIFLELEKFNPASLMVQIQQHMVVVMALNTDSPSHVFMMRPEHAVRVQGSKSRPQPGNGIHIVLQKRSPGNTWSTFGTPLGPGQS